MPYGPVNAKVPCSISSTSDVNGLSVLVSQFSRFPMGIRFLRSAVKQYRHINSFIIIAVPMGPLNQQDGYLPEIHFLIPKFRIRASHSFQQDLSGALVKGFRYFCDFGEINLFSVPRYPFSPLLPADRYDENHGYSLPCFGSASVPSSCSR